jgi:cobalt-zinc-cadmium efflux system outer membrane protein
MAFRQPLWPLTLLLLSGCCSVLPDVSDPAARALALRPLDPEPTRPDPNLRPATLSEGSQAAPEKAPVTKLPDQVTPKDKTQPPDTLIIPRALPGSGAPKVEWPKKPAEREQALKALYPALPALPQRPQPMRGPTGRPLSLTDLQSLAAANSPAVKNALAGVQAARGAVIQAAAFPNPNIFYEADTVGTGAGGYQGAGFDQPIKGANKIKLAKAAAEMDLKNAELALKKAQNDLATQVRSNYFAVLVALENIKVSHALAVFANNVYQRQLDLLKADQAAPYEPIQLRPLYYQARFNLLQAINQFHASWKQLAATLGLPAMPPTELTGRVDMPVPVFDYDQVLQQALSRHTDVLTALNTVQKGRYLLELAQVQPIPDFDIHVLIQKDYTTPQRTIVYSGVLTLPIPIWDQNRGNILQARGSLFQAAHQLQITKLQLTNSLADAYNRYQTYHEQVLIVVKQIEDQVRAYRSIYARYREVGDTVAFGDVVTAQQTLAGFITSYISALGLQWTAVVDMANLLQTDDLFGLGQTEQFAPIPDLGRMLPEVCPPPRPLQLPRVRPIADATGTTVAPSEPGPSWLPPTPVTREEIRLEPRVTLSLAEQLPEPVTPRP